MKKQIQFLICLLYVAPDGVTPEGEKPATGVYTGVFPSLEEALDFAHEWFDGQETFEKRREEIVAHFIDTDSPEYSLDDYSAGQWMEIKRVKNGRAEILMGDSDVIGK